MKKEIWKDIPGYEGLYQASTEGRIKSLPRKKRHISRLKHEETWLTTAEKILTGATDGQRIFACKTCKGWDSSSLQGAYSYTE